MQEIKFKVGDIVKILSEDRTFGWDDEMKKYIGTSTVVQDVNTDMYSCGEYDIGYLIEGWWWSADVLMKVEKKFNPQPGDKIICNNGEEFICCTLDFLHDKISGQIQSSLPILGYYKTKYDETWQDWDEDGTTLCNDFDYGIREVIPAESKEVVKEEEPRYTLEEIKEAWNASGWVAATTTWNTFRGNLVKNAAEYKEYLRLKAIYE